LIENERPCATTVFDGQRLALQANEPAGGTKPDIAKLDATKPDAAKPDASKPDATKPVNAKPVTRRRSSSKRAVSEEPAKKPDPPSTFSSLFRR
jgi:hypothetical protein